MQANGDLRYIDFCSSVAVSAVECKCHRGRVSNT